MLVLSAPGDEILDPYPTATAVDYDALALERAMSATADAGMDSAIAIAALTPDYVAPPSGVSPMPPSVQGPKGGTPHNQPISGWWIVGGVAVLGGIATFVFLQRRARTA